jgi:hypothetical protein
MKRCCRSGSPRRSGASARAGVTSTCRHRPPPTAEQLGDGESSALEVIDALLHAAQPLPATASTAVLGASVTQPATSTVGSAVAYQAQTAGVDMDDAAQATQVTGVLGTAYLPPWASLIADVPLAPAAPAASAAPAAPPITFRDEDDMRAWAALERVAPAIAGQVGASLGAVAGTASSEILRLLQTQPAGPGADRAAINYTIPAQNALAAARQSVQTNGPFNLGGAIQILGVGLANILAGSRAGAVTRVAGSVGASWLQPGAAVAGTLALGYWVIQPDLAAAQTAGPSRRQGLPAEAPRIPQATGYLYLPGYRPSAQPGAQFWLPDLPDGQQFWAPADRVASGEDYRDPDWLNNPQYDPQQPGRVAGPDDPGLRPAPARAAPPAAHGSRPTWARARAPATTSRAPSSPAPARSASPPTGWPAPKACTRRRARPTR